MIAKTKNKKWIYNIILIFLTSLLSCEKFIEVEVPENELVKDNVFLYDESATATVIQLYSTLVNSSNFAGGWIYGLTYMNGLNADEFFYYSTSEESLQFYNNNILSSNASVSKTWSTLYSLIYSSNSILEGLSNSSQLTPSLKDQLKGEALFIRSFSHFYLVNLYGDIPYITTTDYNINLSAKRTPKNEVYENLINDLLQAESLLNDGYSTTGRVRANKWTAKALLARVYLYSENWADAEEVSSSIINNNALYSLTTLNDVFLKNSSETIWQLYPWQGTAYATEGELFILTTTPTRVSLRSEFYNAFEVGDLRKSNWTNSIVVGTNTYYFPFKYKQNSTNATDTEYSMVLRLSEQYLIRAEARAKQNKLIGANSAESDINAIRSRAGLPNTTATSQTQLLDAIEKERRFELFSEWGHRWFDLKRTGRADAALSYKPGWETTDVLWPIPESEILTNQNLTQNDGY